MHSREDQARVAKAAPCAVRKAVGLFIDRHQLRTTNLSPNLDVLVRALDRDFKVLLAEDLEVDVRSIKQGRLLP